MPKQISVKALKERLDWNYDDNVVRVFGGKNARIEVRWPDGRLVDVILLEDAPKPKAQGPNRLFAACKKCGAEADMIDAAGRCEVCGANQ